MYLTIHIYIPEYYLSTMHTYYNIYVQMDAGRFHFTDIAKV